MAVNTAKGAAAGAESETRQTGQTGKTPGTQSGPADARTHPGPAREQGLPLFFQQQAAGDRTGQRGTEGAAVPPKTAEGKGTPPPYPPAEGSGKETSSSSEGARGVPALEQSGRAQASRATSALPDVGPSGAKQAISQGAKQVLSQAGDAAKAAAGAAPAEPAGGQAGSATAGLRSTAPGQEATRSGQGLGEAAEQVAESIRATGGRTGRQVTVRLHPPELGRVRIVLQSEGESVRGTVRVDVPETLSKLQQEAATLMQRLQAEGIDLRRLDVMLNQDQAGGQTGQDAAFRQGHSGPDGRFPGAEGGTPASADGEAGDAAAAEADARDAEVAAAGRDGVSINVQV